MANQEVSITIDASVFGADGEPIGTVTRIQVGLVDVSGFSIPERAFACQRHRIAPRHQPRRGARRNPVRERLDDS